MTYPYLHRIIFLFFTCLSSFIWAQNDTLEIDTLAIETNIIQPSYFHSPFSVRLYAGYPVDFHKIKSTGPIDTLMPHTVSPAGQSTPIEISFNYQFHESFGISIGMEYLKYSTTYRSTHGYFYLNLYDSMTYYDPDRNFFRNQTLNSFSLPVRLFFQDSLGKHFDFNIGMGFKFSYLEWRHIDHKGGEIFFEPNYQRFSLTGSVRPEIRWRFKRSALGLYLNAYYDLTSKVTFKNLKHIRHGLNPGISFGYYIGQRRNE